jgi:biopolymer transport protein ExbD
MTPLIDMVFILLIFFIVATSFVRESGVTVDKPESTYARAVSDGFVLVAITRSGTVHLGGAAINPDDRETIARALNEAHATAVVIQADRLAPVGLVLKVQDSCLAAGAEHVSVGARKP